MILNWLFGVGDYDPNDSTNADSNGGDGGLIGSKHSMAFSAFIIFLVIAIVCLPAIPLFYVLFREVLYKRRQPVSVSMIVSAITIGTGLLLSIFSHPFESFRTIFLRFISDPFLPGDSWLSLAFFDRIQYWFTEGYWVRLVFPYLSLAITLAGMLYFLTALYYHDIITKDKYQLKDPESWLYEFKYDFTPWEKKRIEETKEDLREGELISPEKSPMGMDMDNGRPVFLYESEAVTHTFVVGGTGSGKTVEITNLMHSDIKNGKPTIIIDFKGSRDLAAKLSLMAKKYGRPFRHFCALGQNSYDIPGSEGPSFYDPLSMSYADPTSLGDRILDMRQYSVEASLYEDEGRSLLQFITAPTLTLYKHFKVLEERKLVALKNNDKNAITAYQREFDYIFGHNYDENGVSAIPWESSGLEIFRAVLTKNGVESLLLSVEKGIKNSSQFTSGLRELFVSFNVTGMNASAAQLSRTTLSLRRQLDTLIDSVYGVYLTNPQDENDSYLDGNHINLLDMSMDTKKGPVVLFSLDGDNHPQLAKYLGALVMGDITAMSSHRRERGIDNVVKIYIDEFQTLAPETVSSLLTKARESRLAMILSLQNLSQIEAKSSTAVLRSFTQTCSNFIIHKGLSQDDATLFSGLIGKEDQLQYDFSRRSEKFFWNYIGNIINRLQKSIKTRTVNTWIVPPEKFMALQAPTKTNGYKTTAMVINKQCADPAYEQFNDDGRATVRKMLVIPDKVVLQQVNLPPVIPATSNIKFRTSEDIEAEEAELRRLSEAGYGDFSFSSKDKEILAPEQKDQRTDYNQERQKSKKDITKKEGSTTLNGVLNVSGLSDYESIEMTKAVKKWIGVRARAQDSKKMLSKEEQGWVKKAKDRLDKEKLGDLYEKTKEKLAK